MYRKTIQAIAGVIITSFSLSAATMPLEEYNLILAQDYNFQGGDVEGKAFIGGSLKAPGQAADFGSREPQLTVSDTLQVVGNITAANINIQHGNVVYGGTANVGHFNLNGLGSVIQDSSLSIDAVFSELLDYSADYASLASNASYDMPSKTLNYYGSDALAVFDVNAGDVFAQNTGLKLNYNNAETVIINVSGVDISVAGGVNLLDGFRHEQLGAPNILWNFFEAESVDFRDINMFGAVLAPLADIRGGAVFDGSVGANSYTGGREFHRFLFNPPTTEVSEANSAALLLLGLITLVTARRKRLF